MGDPDDIEHVLPGAQGFVRRPDHDGVAVRHKGAAELFRGCLFLRRERLVRFSLQQIDDRGLVAAAPCIQQRRGVLLRGGKDLRTDGLLQSVDLRLLGQRAERAVDVRVLLDLQNFRAVGLCHLQEIAVHAAVRREARLRQRQISCQQIPENGHVVVEHGLIAAEVRQHLLRVGVGLRVQMGVDGRAVGVDKTAHHFDLRRQVCLQRENVALHGQRVAGGIGVQKLLRIGEAVADVDGAEQVERAGIAVSADLPEQRLCWLGCRIILRGVVGERFRRFHWRLRCGLRRLRRGGAGAQEQQREGQQHGKGTFHGQRSFLNRFPYRTGF